MHDAALKRTPLDACHRQAGARLVPFAGWELPIHYSGLVNEHRAVRQRAGLFDVSHMGEIEISGARAEAFLQHLTPNDVGRLEIGQAHYSALLTERGTLLDDLLIYRLGRERFLMVVNAAPLESDLAWIEERAPPAGVAIRDRSQTTALLALQGPAAESILDPLTDADLTAVGYYRFVESSVDRVPALVSRTGYTGEDGFEIYLAPEAAAQVWRRLLEVGTEAGLCPAGLGARDTLRLEAGLLLSGQDFDRETTPLEVGLGWLVKLEKGDFLGRAALARQQQEGPERRLIGFELLERGVPRSGQRVLVDGEAAGKVTSGSWSPTLERGLGLAMLVRAQPDVGSEIDVEVRNRRLRARRVKLPFYRRRK